MLDTLMVLWARGICGRFLRAVVTFLLLLASICALLFLVTASGVKWSSLAVAVSSSEVTATTTIIHATPTPPLAAYSVPIILQNPTAIPATPTPTVTPLPTSVPTSTPTVVYSGQREGWRVGGGHHTLPFREPTPGGSKTLSTPTVTPTPIPTPTPEALPTATPVPTPDDSNQLFFP